MWVFKNKKNKKERMMKQILFLVFFMLAFPLISVCILFCSIPHSSSSSFFSFHFAKTKGNKNESS
jgi:hypothetical protein